MFVNQYLLEKLKRTKYKFSSFEVRIDDPYINHIKYLQSFINVNDLTKDGIEKNSHITILYGVNTEDKNIIRDAFFNLKMKSFYVEVDKVHIFENETDVIVLKCKSPELKYLRKFFLSRVPTAKQSHPEYIPHITLAYLKKGTGIKYKELLESKFKNTRIKINFIYFSNRMGNSIRYKLLDK